MNQPTVTLKPESRYYEIFPNGIAPVKSAIAELMPIVDLGAELGWMLDADRCSSEQLEDVVRAVAEVFCARVSDVRDELIERGLPIRMSQVEVFPQLELRAIL
jgi:hypothetical protein